MGGGAAQAGQSFTVIAARFGITKSEVSRLVTKYRETGNVKDVPRSGHPKVTTERQDRLIIQHSRRNRFKTARQIRDDLQG